MLKYIAPILLIAPLAGCAWFTSMLGPAPAPTASVAAWSGVSIILDRLESEAGTQPEIEGARLELSDADGDGSFPLESVRFLVEPSSWAVPFLDPLNLYTASVETDPFLSPSGVAARVASANVVRYSLNVIFAP